MGLARRDRATDDRRWKRDWPKTVEAISAQLLAMKFSPLRQEVPMSPVTKPSERGSARLKFLVVVAIIASVAYAGYLYIPVAYQAYLFKDLMQHDVDVAATQGYPASWVKDQLTKAAPEYGVPPDAVIAPTQRENRVEVTVQFVRPIEFSGYTYQYDFDHTAKSSSFLAFK